MTKEEIEAKLSELAASRVLAVRVYEEARREIEEIDRLTEQLEQKREKLNEQ